MVKQTVRKKTVPSRNASKTLEERHIGSEILDWSEMTEAKVFECLRHYSYFYEIGRAHV